MCGNVNCTLAKQDRIRLRRLCVELAGDEGKSLFDFRVDAAHLIFDVCDALTIKQCVVMDARTVYAIQSEAGNRLWPTLTESEYAEMAETDAIREPEYPDRIHQESRDGGVAVWRY